MKQGWAFAWRSLMSAEIYVYILSGIGLGRVPELREICVGVWEQQTWGDIYRGWPEQMKYFSFQPHLWQVEGAERPQDVLERGLKAVRKIAAEHDGQTVAIFSHGYIIRLMLGHLQGESLEQTGKSRTGDNTSVALLEAEGDSLRVVFRDDNSEGKGGQTGQRTGTRFALPADGRGGTRRLLCGTDGGELGRSRTL